MLVESLARRARSIEILKGEGVPFTEHLPAIEDEFESTRRTTEDVAKRAIALCLVAIKGEGVEESFWKAQIEQFGEPSGFPGDFTPKELAFIHNMTPSRRDLAQFSWRYECFWVMLWALGFVGKLGRPDQQCKVSIAYSFLKSRGREGFFKDAKLRSQAEILDEADLIYRYHWAVVDARINRREIPPWLAAGAGVVMERHYSLNWLVGYMDQAWDDVTTDT
jgi:hypothetical protein